MALNLPPKRHFNQGYDHDEVLAWNACLEEVKRLNPEHSAPAGEAKPKPRPGFFRRLIERLAHDHDGGF